MQDILKAAREMKGAFDPQKQSDRDQMEKLMSGMKKEDAEKVKSLLSDPQALQNLMQSSAVQQLMKALGGGKNHG